jgi:hypothetical protein
MIRSRETVGSLVMARDGHGAALLASGKVFVTGGTKGSVAPASEVYDPVTNKSLALGTASVGVNGVLPPIPTLTLPSGQVFATGALVSESVPPRIVQLAAGAGDSATCAVLSNGLVRCWGKNDSGQLGDGTTTNRSTPVTVNLGSVVASSVSTGTHHRCAGLTDETARCWGKNGSGQLGDGTTLDRLTPVQVKNLNSIVSVHASGSSSYALLYGGGA